MLRSAICGGVDRIDLDAPAGRVAFGLTPEPVGPSLANERFINARV